MDDYELGVLLNKTPEAERYKQYIDALGVYMNAIIESLSGKRVASLSDADKDEYLRRCLSQLFLLEHKHKGVCALYGHVYRSKLAVLLQQGVVNRVLYKNVLIDDALQAYTLQQLNQKNSVVTDTGWLWHSGDQSNVSYFSNLSILKLSLLLGCWGEMCLMIDSMLSVCSSNENKEAVINVLADVANACLECDSLAAQTSAALNDPVFHWMEKDTVILYGH